MFTPSINDALLGAALIGGGTLLLRLYKHSTAEPILPRVERIEIVLGMDPRGGTGMRGQFDAFALDAQRRHAEAQASQQAVMTQLMAIGKQMSDDTHRLDIRVGRLEAHLERRQEHTHSRKDDDPT